MTSKYTPNRNLSSNSSFLPLSWTQKLTPAKYSWISPITKHLGNISIKGGWQLWRILLFQRVFTFALSISLWEWCFSQFYIIQFYVCTNDFSMLDIHHRNSIKIVLILALKDVRWINMGIIYVDNIHYSYLESHIFWWPWKGFILFLNSQLATKSKTHFQ